MPLDNEQHLQVTAPVSGSSGEFSVSGSQSFTADGLRHWTGHANSGCRGVPAAPESTPQVRGQRTADLGWSAALSIREDGCNELQNCFKAENNSKNRYT